MKFRSVIRCVFLSLVLTGMFVPEPYISVNAQKNTSNKTRRSKSRKSNTNSSGSKVQSSAKSSGETSADVRKKQEATQKEIQQTEEQIKENEKSVRNSLRELSKIEEDITVSKKKISNLSSQINTLNNRISKLEQDISSDEAELARLREEYLKAIKKMRVAGKNNSDLAFIFSSSSFNQAVRRMRYLKEFSEWKDRQSDAISSTIASLKKEKEGLAKTQEQHARALSLQKSEQSKLESQYAQQNSIVVSLKKNGEALHAHLSKKQAEANELKNRISSLIAEEQRKAAEERERQEAAKRAEQERLALEEKQRKLDEENRKKAEETKKNTKETKGEKEIKKEESQSSNPSYADARKRKPRSQQDSKSSSTTETSSKSVSKIATVNENSQENSFAGMKGRLPSPVNGSIKVTSRFGTQTLPDLPDVVYDNPGIDAEVAAGASAQAVYEGKVSGIYMLPGYNTVVIVNHGNYYTVYGNLSSPAVKVGDKVNAGQKIGTVVLDEDDLSHGSIHFEVWKNREKLNPLEWIRI